MKRFLYTLSIVAMLFVGGCTQGLNDFSTLEEKIISEIGEGEVLLSFNLRIPNADIHTVTTRAVPSQENVTDIVGSALVFGNEPGKDTYGNNSPLLQKVSFKTVDSKVYITLKEQTEACFICLVTSMTDVVKGQVDAIATYEDYKALTVDLLGYYTKAEKPDPADLTTNHAFPLASPFIDMPGGLTEETVADLNKDIDMVPPAAKVDVTSNCNFVLKSVTLYNGAMQSYMSNEVWEEDRTVVESMQLPLNLGGTTEFAAVPAIDNTTAATPIYIFPNDGNAKGSDEIQGKNPTYLIIEGTAAGYGVGYYKIPIRYQKNGDFSYDIERNKYYKVNLTRVANAGYATQKKAIEGAANDIAYDITIDGGNTSNDDTFTDPRAETIVSDNGFFYIELVGSEIFAQGYGKEGVKGNIGLSLTSNKAAIKAGYTIPDLTVTTWGNITIPKEYSTIKGDFAGTIEFTAKEDGYITLRCGDVVKVIHVHYRETPHKYGAGTTIGGQNLGSISELAADDLGYTYTKNGIMDGIMDGIITAKGEIAENKSYKNREFRGKAYPTSMSKGIYKVYIAQASNFDLNTYYNNTAAGNGGDSDINNIFTFDDLTSTYTANFNYQSTGKIHKLNTELNGSYDNNRIMDKWYIGTAPITFTAKGEFTTSNASSNKDSKNNLSINKDFIDYNWAGLTDGSKITLSARNIEGNQPEGSNYDSKYAKIENSATVTLSNIAGEKKVYNFELEQSAAPYINGLDLVNGIYQWNCPVVADCHNSGQYDKNPIYTTPTVYNAHYKGGSNEWDPVNFEKSSYWSWTEAEDEDGYTGGSSGLTSVLNGVSVGASSDSVDAYEYYFKVNVKKYEDGYWLFGWHDGKNPTDESKKQAYFDLRLLNDAGELIILRLRLRRQDKQ